MIVTRNTSLAPLTYYQIGGAAREVYYPETPHELARLLSDLTTGGTPFFILGGGTNLLVGDDEYEGAVIATARLDSIDIRPGGIVCGAGVTSTKIAETARDNDLTGLEFLYQLPGSVGGATAGNARYGGVNVSDVLVAVTAAHPIEGLQTFRREEFEAGYKYMSLTTEGWVIAAVELRCMPGDPIAIEGIMQSIELARSSSHHFDYPSCGCVFKNDHTRNIQVGRLLDSLGCKGMRSGNAMVAPFHANFIINTGNATACDVLSLVEQLENLVHDHTGVHLEREMRLAGTFKKTPAPGEGNERS